MSHNLAELKLTQIGEDTCECFASMLLGLFFIVVFIMFLPVFIW